MRDRIVQRSLLEELYFPLEDTFLDCSYAYRPGHNIQQAVEHLYSYYQFQPKWIIKADIAELFDSLCWALLLTALEELQLEPIVVQLLEGQLRSGIGWKVGYDQKHQLSGNNPLTGRAKQYDYNRVFHRFT